MMGVKLYERPIGTKTRLRTTTKEDSFGFGCAAVDGGSKKFKVIDLIDKQSWGMPNQCTKADQRSSQNTDLVCN